MPFLEIDQSFCAEDIFHDLFLHSSMGAEGLLYEKRESQEKMAQGVWSAFAREEYAFFEAGTGVGKSLSYLVPAAKWHLKTKERIVISTHTISLQEQLIEKELPLLQKALGSHIYSLLAKGMNNYFCLYKAEELATSSSLFSQESSITPEQAQILLKWSRSTREGTKSSLGISLPSLAWKAVSAERQSCLGSRCSYFKHCFFFQARKELEEAGIIFVNHHLLLSHLKGGAKQPLLPPFTRLIIDEAHHFLSTARLCLASSIDRVELFTLLAKLHAETHPEKSWLLKLLQKEEVQRDLSLQHLIGLELISEKKKLLILIQKAFDAVEEIVQDLPKRGGQWRITASFMQSTLWLHTIRPLFNEVIKALFDYCLSLEKLGKKFQEKQENDQEGQELLLMAKQLQEKGEILSLFFETDPTSHVHWIEKIEVGASLRYAALDVKKTLETSLFASLKTTVFCSATLAVAGSFSHVVKDLGCEEKKRQEAIYPSPFNFEQQAKLLVPSDLPGVGEKEFMNKAAIWIGQALAITQGGCFILFTSYEMLQLCAEKLSSLPYPLFVQGRQPRHQLLEAFKKEKKGVLLGADSFWEGVDVAGRALRLLILTKLPFAVPTTPLAEALAEKLKNEGKDPFLEGALPQAIVKFKQGFGRLIRSSQDRGCIVCLDKRLFLSSYRHSFLQSLPLCPHRFAPGQEIIQEMKQFYASTRVV